MNRPIYVKELFEEDFFGKWISYLLKQDVNNLYKFYIDLVENTIINSASPIYLYHDVLDENITLGNNQFPLSYNHYKAIREKDFYSTEILFEEIKLKEEIQETDIYLSKVFNHSFIANLMKLVLLKQVGILFKKKITDKTFESQFFSNNLATLRYELWQEILQIIIKSLELIRKNFIKDTKNILNLYLEHDVIFFRNKDEKEQKEIRNNKTEDILENFINEPLGDFKGWSQKEINLIYQLKHYYDFCLEVFTKYRRYTKEGRNDLLIELANDLQLEDFSLFEYISSEDNQKEIISELPSSTALSFVYNTSEPWVREKYKKNPRSLRNAFIDLDTKEKEQYFIQQLILFEKRIKEFTDPNLRTSILNGLEHLKGFVPPRRVELFKKLQVGIEENKSFEKLKDLFDRLKSNILFYSHSEKYSLLKELRLSFLFKPEKEISIEEQQKKVLLLTEKLKQIL